jgi:plastocyanin
MKKNRRILLVAGLPILAIALPLAAQAAGSGVQIQFEDHHFTPQTLTVPAGQPITINVINKGNETIEFESFKLNREKVVSPGATITVHLPALSPGSYDFYDDFHQDVPEGSIVAK